jgi:hypothetical protein
MTINRTQWLRYTGAAVGGASLGAIVPEVSIRPVIKRPLLNINDVMAEHFDGAPTFLLRRLEAALTASARPFLHPWRAHPALPPGRIRS